jgi:hypothetical protein
MRCVSRVFFGHWKGRCGLCMIDACTAATNSQWVFQTSVDVTPLLLLLLALGLVFERTRRSEDLATALHGEGRKLCTFG